MKYFGTLNLRASPAMLCLLLAAGCVSTPVRPVARADLMVARADDQVQLEWQSEPGFLYTISWSETIGAGARWQPLPQAMRLRGTGRRIAVSDRVPPARPRFYDILIEPAGAAGSQRSRATKTPSSGR